MQATDDISNIIDPLNAAQREAVCAPEANLLVLAGAGSGKTRVLIHRIAYLVQVLQVPAHAIMAVTFTNKAATEMRGRLYKLLGSAGGRMWVGTFHGLSHRLLRLHWQDAGLSESFQILDSDDQLRSVKRVMKALQLDEKAWPPKQAQWYINQKKDQALRPDDIEPRGDKYELTMQLVYRHYQNLCEQNGMVDFAELLLRSYELWKHKPDILQHYQQRFTHLLVDEFQDTNHIQYLWLHILASKTGKIFAVGDDDQSIYGWRGAKLSNLQALQQEFSDTKLLRLEQNYRSTGTILAAANALISNNSQRLGKNLWTDGQEGNPIATYQAYNEYDEARFIAGRIQSWYADEQNYTDCAILYRSNAQSRVIEETLLQAQIPYRVYGGLRFFDRAEIKDALAYLRLLANTDDDTAFERVVNNPPRGIGERTVETIRQQARRLGISLWQASENCLESKQLTNRAANALQRFLQLIQQLHQDTQHMALMELTEQVVAHSGLIEHFKNKKNERDKMRVENLEELVNATRQYHSPKDSANDDKESLTPLMAFLTDTALDSGEEQADGPQDAVQLMTLHSAKGLEFPLVFLCGMEEKLFPHGRALQEGDIGLEEERRLCYVGMTRAMQQLYISYAEVRRLHGSENYCRPSRFLNEIPIELTEDVRLQSVSSHNIYTPEDPQPVANSSFNLGQVVNHPLFGDGVILDMEGTGATERVQVNFSEGSKWLILTYANLQAKE